MATYASDGTSASVQAFYNAAVDGDIITIPAGSFTWTTGVRFIGKNVTLQGAGTGSTTIADSVEGHELIYWELAANGLGRITGIDFIDGGRVAQGAAPTGVIHINGRENNASQFRFDHNTWTHVNGFLVTNTVLGCVDNNVVTVGVKSGEFHYIYGSQWNGQELGDGSWTAPVHWGSEEFIFLEDNTFISINATFEGQVTDAFEGGRYVARHNVVTNMSFNNHGTESSGRGRSGRAMEIYNNTFDLNHVNRFISGSRGGPILYHHNTVTGAPGGPGNASPVTLNALRMFGSFPAWGGADGTNSWDHNDPGNPFYSGTITSVNLTTQKVTITGAGWTVNQWTGYTLKLVLGSSGSGTFSYIDSNTIDTITFRSDPFGGVVAWAPGQIVEINKVLQSIDQAGAGVSTLVTNYNPPIPSVPFTQGVDPSYSWANTNEGSDFNTFDTLSPSTIRVGEHFFNNTIPPGYVEYEYPHPLQSGTLLPPVEAGGAVVIAGVPIF